jgi:prevent-host-death family protein
MEVSLTDAKAQLTELVRRAEAGDEVILTRRGRPSVQLVPVRAKRSPEEKMAMMLEIAERAAKKATPGPCAARSQDFLYNHETGLPE